MKIEIYNPHFIRIDPSPRCSTLLSGDDLRELAVWMKKNRPEILHNVMCEDCPEVC